MNNSTEVSIIGRRKEFGGMGGGQIKLRLVLALGQKGLSVLELDLSLTLTIKDSWEPFAYV